MTLQGPEEKLCSRKRLRDELWWNSAGVEVFTGLSVETVRVHVAVYERARQHG